MVSHAFVRTDDVTAVARPAKQTGLQRSLTQTGSACEPQTSNVLLGLQRSHGNRYVQRLVNRAGPPIQARLRLGPGGDQYEHEADQVAQTMAQDLASRRRRAGGNARSIRHRPLAGSGDLDARLGSAVERARGYGQPLPENVRGQMELALGADFSAVRVHSDTLADRLNGSLDARAFTTGKDIFFRRGEYHPGSPGSQRLLAHELVHVVQQGAPGAPDRAGSRAGPASDGVIQRVRRGGSYDFIWLQAVLTNVYRPVYLMATARDGFSQGENVVVKFEDEDELMAELFFSKVAARSNQMIPDMRRMNKTEVARCKDILTLYDIQVEKYNNALVMDYIPGKKLESLRASGGAPYQLSDQQLRNIGRLLAFQIFMGGQDMLPSPSAGKHNFGNVIVSAESNAVSMIDVTPGFYSKPAINPDVAAGLKLLIHRTSGGPLTEGLRKELAHSIGTFHDVGEPGRQKIRKGFIESMRDILDFDLAELDRDWKAVFPGWPYDNAIKFMRQMQELFQALL